MTLSPVEYELTKIKATQNPNFFTFGYAIKHKRIARSQELFLKYLEYLKEAERGEVINIFGSDKSGRSTTGLYLLERIARTRQQRYSITYNYEKAHKDLEQNEVILIEQGRKIKEHLPQEDEYGIIQLKASANKKKAVVIVISDKQIPGCNLYLQALEVEKENNANHMIVILDLNVYFGIIRIKPDFEKLENAIKIDQEAKKEFLKIENQRILENIKETTNDLLKRWMKRKEIIFAEDPKNIDKEDPPILFIPVIILGGQQDGKSTLAKILVNILVDYYGIKHVHALRSERQLIDMINNAFSSDKEKFCQVFIADDFTFTKFKLDDFQDFTMIRHKMAEAGILQGVAFVIMNLHYLTGTASPVAIRNILKFLFVLNATDHEYTRNTVLSKFLPESHISFLDYIQELKEQAELDGDPDEYLRLKGFGVCYTRGRSFPFHLNKDSYPIYQVEKHKISELVLAEQQTRKTNLRFVDDQFYNILRFELDNYLQTKSKNQDHIKWTIEYYCSPETLTHLDIAEMDNRNLGYNTIGKAIRGIKKILQKDLTNLGVVLEKTLQKYFKEQFSTDFFRGSGGRNQPDLLFNDLAINCKFFLNSRASWDNLECTPENQYKKPFLFLYDRENGLRIIHNKERLPYVSVNNQKILSVDNFVKSFLLNTGEKKQ